MELTRFFKSRKGGELTAFVFLAAGVTLAESLVSYHPTDSSAFFTSTTSEISGLRDEIC